MFMKFIFFNKKSKKPWKYYGFFPNVSCNSPILPPTIQRGRLEKMLEKNRNDGNQMVVIKCNVKCDNIVKDNLIDLTFVKKIQNLFYF